MAIVVVIAAAIGGGVWWVIRSRTAEPQMQPEPAATVEARRLQADRDGHLRDTAAAEAQKGDVGKVDELYAQAIAGENTAARKIQLYVDQSGVLYAAGKYSEAFEAARQAEGLGGDQFLVADWLSRIYEDQKDYVTAAKYYRLAGQWAGSPQNQTGITKAMYDKEAERVEKLTAGTGQ